MYSRLSGLVAAVLLLAICAGAPARAASETSGEALAAEYALLRAEQAAAADSQPYFVIDLDRLEFQIRMAGTIVWQAEMTVVGDDSTAVATFASQFTEQGREPRRTITDCHVFEAAERLSDSLLAIVGSSLHVSPDSLQRLLPQRLRVDWPDGLALTILTDAAGTPRSRIGNLLASLSHLVEQPFHGADLTVHMSPEAALTIFRLGRTGMTTLVIEPRTIGPNLP